MKYLRYITCIFVLFITCTESVNALACSNETMRELTTLAEYVKASYEVIDASETKDLTIGEDSTTYIIPNFTFQISVYNITKDLYIKIKDDAGQMDLTVNNQDTKSGVYTFENSDFGTIHKYTINVLSNKDACKGTNIKSFEIIQPKYNAYSEFTYCKNSSILYCQKFVTEDLGLKGTDDFLKKIKTNNGTPQTGENTDNEFSVQENIKENWKLYIVVFLAVVIITVVVIIIIRTRQKKSGWEL